MGARLKLYNSKLMILPRKSKAKKGDTTRQEALNVPQNTTKEIIPLPKIALKEKARAITDEEKAFCAKTALRTAWANKHYDGKKRSGRRRSRMQPLRLSERRWNGRTLTFRSN